MPLDPVLLSDTRAWFHKAMVDLRSAEADLRVAPPILDDAVFHCQQAAEKAIKGFLTYHQQPFTETHDLGDLGKACAPRDPTLAPVLEHAAPLTGYFRKFRYPGFPDAPTLDETREALSAARELVAALLDRVPEEARP